MPDVDSKPDPAPRRTEVAHYLSDMSAQLAAMARGAGLNEVAAALAQARDLCEDAIESDLN